MCLVFTATFPQSCSIRVRFHILCMRYKVIEVKSVVISLMLLSKATQTHNTKFVELCSPNCQLLSNVTTIPPPVSEKYVNLTTDTYCMCCLVLRILTSASLKKGSDCCSSTWRKVVVVWLSLRDVLHLWGITSLPVEGLTAIHTTPVKGAVKKTVQSGWSADRSFKEIVRWRVWK